MDGFDYYVDAETGEMFAKNDYRLQNVRQINAYREMKKREEMRLKNRGRNWVACYHETLRELIRKLSLDEMGALIKLLPYMRFNKSGQLLMDDVRMGAKEIAKAIGKKERQTKTLISALVKAGVLREEKEGRRKVYSVDRAYHTIGITPGSPFTKLFQSFAKKQLEKLTIQQAGVLYAALPFFHYKSYLLCNNPDEPDENKADPMDAKELAEKLNVNYKTLYRHLDALSKKGLILKVGAYGVTIYRAHPDLMFRAEVEDEFTEKVRQDFRDAMRAYRKICF